MAEQPAVFGPFQLDHAGVVWRDGRPLAIGRRGVRLLEALLSRRGQVVPKAELIDAAWPGEVVEDNNLSVQMAQLRKRLGAEWIRTVERVGYQFVDAPPLPLVLVPPAIEVRPLRNADGAADIAAALSGEVTTALTRFGALRVSTTLVGTSTADYVLDGDVHRDISELRIILRLAERRRGSLVWAERINVRDADRLPIDRMVSMIQTEVEHAEIAAAHRERPLSDRAPDLFRLAQLQMQTSLPDTYGAATQLLERALEHEPNNVRYLGAMCETIGQRISMGWAELPGAGADRMAACATHGLRQAALDADALALFGFGLFRSGDPDGGYNLIRRAADLNPRSVKAVCLAGQAAMNWGRLSDAEAYFRKGLKLAPQHPSQSSIMSGLSRIRMAQGRFEDALRWATRAHAINANFGGTHWTLVAANAMLGRSDEATRLLARFHVGHPGVTRMRIKAGQPSRARLSSTLEGLARAGLA